MQTAMKRFRGDLSHWWGDALDSLEELVASCAELGDLISRTNRADTKLFTALDLLRTRSVQIGWEVHELASAGYADGAFARWRTLHELAVVSEFLKQFGEDAATRYMEHVHISNRKVIREYNECSEQLGYARIPTADIARSEETKERLLSLYGADFANDWGWAAGVPGVSGRSFLDLREATGYGHWKAHYGMANHAIHAGPHGVLFRLGHPINFEPRSLSGPSLVGIGTPVDTTAISLMHTTFSFVSAVRTSFGGFECELEITSSIRFIAGLAREIGEQVLEMTHNIQAEFGRSDSC